MVVPRVTVLNGISLSENALAVFDFDPSFSPGPPFDFSSWAMFSGHCRTICVLNQTVIWEGRSTSIDRTCTPSYPFSSTIFQTLKRQSFNIYQIAPVFNVFFYLIPSKLTHKSALKQRKGKGRARCKISQKASPWKSPSGQRWRVCCDVTNIRCCYNALHLQDRSLYRPATVEEYGKEGRN